MPPFLNAASVGGTFVVCAMLLGCGGEKTLADGERTASVTYYGAAKAVVDARCATCHQTGDIGPFPLTTYEEVKAFEGAVRASIVNGTMPPWQPSDDCNTYTDNYDLTSDERELLLTWLDEGAAAGTRQVRQQAMLRHK